MKTKKSVFPRQTSDLIGERVYSDQEKAKSSVRAGTISIGLKDSKAETAIKAGLCIKPVTNIALILVRKRCLLYHRA